LHNQSYRIAPARDSRGSDQSLFLLARILTRPSQGRKPGGRHESYLIRVWHHSTTSILRDTERGQPFFHSTRSERHPASLIKFLYPFSLAVAPFPSLTLGTGNTSGRLLPFETSRPRQSTTCATSWLSAHHHSSPHHFNRTSEENFEVARSILSTSCFPSSNLISPDRSISSPVRLSPSSWLKSPARDRETLGYIESTRLERKLKEDMDLAKEIFNYNKR